MKLLYSILFSIVFCTCTLFSQWIYQYPPGNTSYYITMNFVSNQIGAAGGTYIFDFYGRGAFTTNGGSNWINSEVPDSSRVLLDICFINTTTGYCAGAYNYYQNTEYYTPAKYNKYLQVLNSQINKSNISILENYKGLFLKTTNSGQNWFTYGELPLNVYYMLGLFFVNTTTGFSIVSLDNSGGVNDGVIKTTNGGSSWQVLTLPENINNLNDVYFIDENTGFVCGYDKVNDTVKGVILKTTNSGTSWLRQLFNNVSQFRRIDFSNSTTGLAVSGPSDPMITTGSNVFRTTNAGANWNLIIFIADVDLQGVEFVNSSSNAFIYGSKYLSSPYFKDYIAATTDYGLNWVQGSFNDTGLIILNSYLIDANNWYLTGGDFESGIYPVILHTGNGTPVSLSQLSTEIPSTYRLKQNYPNPFNPVTNIEFSIPKASFVKLVVYDVMGREVSLLVKQSLTAGTYKAHWNAADMPSGIYFYRITTSDYTETKRMILVK